MMRWVLAAFALFTAQTAVAFTVAPRAVGGARAWTPPARVSRAPARSSVTMMGKMAKFGIFSPVVLAAKNLLGEKELNKLRGQGITLHSQVHDSLSSFFFIPGVEQVQAFSTVVEYEPP